MMVEAESKTETMSYRIESHGVDGEQYFPGASVSDTAYKYVVTGVGETEAGAYNDAVESIAWTWGDVLIEELGLPKRWGDDEHDVCEDCECNGDVAGCDESCELHYYVSVYF